MRRTSALTVSALALTLALSVAGCSSDTPSPDSTTGASSSPSASSGINATPASGDAITGDGYAYNIPEGWGQQDKSVAPGTDTVAADLAPTSDFASNVNVVVSTGGAITPDVVESSAAEELEKLGATDVVIYDRITVAGSESAHISAVVTASGVTYLSHQYYVPKDDGTYIATFSFDQSIPADTASDIADSVLASWSWS